MIIINNKKELEKFLFNNLKKEDKNIPHLVVTEKRCYKYSIIIYDHNILSLEDLKKIFANTNFRITSQNGKIISLEKKNLNNF